MLEKVICRTDLIIVICAPLEHLCVASFETCILMLFVVHIRYFLPFVLEENQFFLGQSLGNFRYESYAINVRQKLSEGNKAKIGAIYLKVLSSEEQSAVFDFLTIKNIHYRCKSQWQVWSLSSPPSGDLPLLLVKSNFQRALRPLKDTLFHHIYLYVNEKVYLSVQKLW